MRLKPNDAPDFKPMDVADESLVTIYGTLDNWTVT